MLMSDVITPPHSSSFLLTPPHSSSLLLTPQKSGSIGPYITTQDTGKIFPNEFFLGEIVVESIEAEPWKANLTANDCKFQFKLDSGADVTVVPKHLYDKLSNKRKVKLQSTDKILLGPCNYRLNCLGKFNARITSENEFILEEIYVVKDLRKPLLGKSACVSLNLLGKINEVENSKAAEESKYKQQN
jgi:hypothetical protein